MKFSDPILQKLVKKYPAPHFADNTNKLYEDLVESIISQQLSVKASDTIYRRFKALFGKDTCPTPKEVLAMQDEQLRTAGISFQKISYIKSVADAFISDLIDLEKIKKMSDEEVIAALTQIRGVGKWTAEMILIFTLNRPDVFSLGDLGLRNAITKLYGITDQKKMLELSETWKPYRSTACWYLWRSLENKD
jgi:DNA-3-methyladenine glycosylase II